MNARTQAALDRLVPALAGAGWPAPVAGRVVIVTGAAGSIGRAVTRRCLDAGARRVVLVDVDENGLYLLGRRLERERCGERITLALASIRERGRLESLFATHRPDVVLHSAAHKHLPLLETAPSEAVRNNVLATASLCDLAHAAGCAFVLVSTDKAVAPASVLGRTKRIAERIVWSYSPAAFRVARLGNVLGSAGSVVPLFLEQIAHGGPLTVTHREARRYFSRVEDAAALVVAAIDPEFGPLAILDPGPPLAIERLAQTLIEAADGSGSVSIEYTGLRPGERLDEALLSATEAAHATSVVPHVLRVRRVPTTFDRDAVLPELAEAVRTECAERIRECLDYATDPPAARDAPSVAEP